MNLVEASKLVENEVNSYNIMSLFSHEQLIDMAYTCRFNVNTYKMDGVSAARDAVANVMMDNQIEIPNSYLKRFWFA